MQRDKGYSGCSREKQRMLPKDDENSKEVETSDEERWSGAGVGFRSPLSIQSVQGGRHRSVVRYLVPKLSIIIRYSIENPRKLRTCTFAPQGLRRTSLVLNYVEYLNC